MTNISLQGPFTLSASTIESMVPEVSFGGYVLGFQGVGNHMTVRFVGRSVSSLRGRLHEHERENIYGDFGYQVCESALEAYMLECRLYHEFASEDIDNEIHPVGISLLDTCPVCGG